MTQVILRSIVFFETDATWRCMSAIRGGSEKVRQGAFMPIGFELLTS